MKHFIYTDTDVLNSYISQINNGLIKSSTAEIVDELATSSNTETLEGGNKFESEMGFKPIFSLKFSEDPDVIKTTNTLSQIESGKELIEKLLHDNALQLFENHLKDTDSLKDLSNCDIGDYVKFTDNYIIRDLDNILSVYTDEFINFISEQVPADESKNKNIRKQKCATAKKEQEDTRRILRIAKSILASSQFILCNNCFIPLEPKFLRQSTSTIRFNYSGKVTVIAKYTSTLSKSVKSNNVANSHFDNIFDSIDDVNSVFYTDTLGVPLESKIMVPIALYFE